MMNLRKLAIRSGYLGAVGLMCGATIAIALAARKSSSLTPRGDEEVSAARGRYIVRVGGCNDCHTPGFMQHGEDVPESEWLTGVPVGWKGPWGTTYASNLRLFAKDFDEQTWVQVLRARKSRPPMPWPNLHAMTDQDLRSVHRYIRSLPVVGTKMPAHVPPGEEPFTPYVELVPQAPKAMVISQVVGE